MSLATSPRLCCTQLERLCGTLGPILAGSTLRFPDIKFGQFDRVGLGSYDPDAVIRVWADISRLWVSRTNLAEHSDPTACLVIHIRDFSGPNMMYEYV